MTCRRFRRGYDSFVRNDAHSIAQMRVSQFRAGPVICYHLDKKVCEHFNQPQVWRCREEADTKRDERNPRPDLVGFARFKLPWQSGRGRAQRAAGAVSYCAVTPMGRLDIHAKLRLKRDRAPAPNARGGFLIAPGITITGNDVRRLHNSFNERIGHGSHHWNIWTRHALRD